MKKIRIRHQTHYTYSEPVTLLPHRLMLRPRSGHDILIESSSLTVSAPHEIIWQRDIYGNSVGVVTFRAPQTALSIHSEVLLQHFDFALPNVVVDERARMFPFHFDLSERVEMIPYQMPCFPSDGEAVRDWVSQFWRPGQLIETFQLLDGMCNAIATGFTYGAREEPGVQRPADTIARRAGSCRDYATLFIEGCRFLGLAARFVSGYLHSPATRLDDGSTHAWCEVYLPGAGWKGFDTTSGRITGSDHIAVAVTRHPADAPPISGSYIGPPGCESTMKVVVDVIEEPAG